MPSDKPVVPPIQYPPQGEAPVITPSDWASWINELPSLTAGAPAPQMTIQTVASPVVPPIIEEAHQQPRNLITADTLRGAPTASVDAYASSVGSNASRSTLQDSDDETDENPDAPVIPPIENYTSLTRATSGPKHLERALYGQVNPLLVAEAVFGIADEGTLAEAYGMTLAELRNVITSKPFQTAADSLRKAWETNPQLDTQFRAKQSFDYLLPILTAQAADPKAHPGFKAKLLELAAKIGNVMPKETINAAGNGNTFAIQIILPGADKKDEDDFKIIDGSEL